MPELTHILVVDDERELRKLLRSGLEAEGFTVAEAASRADLFRSLEGNSISLITLDLKLGHVDGLSLAREIRTSRNVPIIMITGLDTPLDRVTGLEHGADDYITKPFHIREVVIRVRRVLATYGLLDAAQPKVGRPQCYAFEGLFLDVRKNELRSTSGTFIELTETEFQLLEVFVRYPGRVLSRDEITQMLRGHDWSPLDRMIDGHVSRLRRKIDISRGEEPVVIKSVRGFGYVFTGEVRQL